MPRRLAGLLLAALLIAAVAQPGAAADIKVLTAGAMRGVIAELLPQFEKDTGHKVSLDNATAGTLATRIEAGEAFDVAVITPKVIDSLAEKGKVVPGTRVDVAKVGIGVAVKEGAARPDIATVEAFIDDYKHADTRRYASNLEPLLVRIIIRLVDRTLIIENRDCVVERHPVFPQVARGLVRVPCLGPIRNGIV